MGNGEGINLPDGKTACPRRARNGGQRSKGLQLEAIRFIDTSQPRAGLKVLRLPRIGIETMLSRRIEKNRQRGDKPGLGDHSTLSDPTMESRS